ncbi:ATP-binding protein, partial [Oscillochloris sp. ZM17-4]|uniref:AAA family ATPase n=1 Tax=Oscillochloris sp. ZM17-4 TaxID=2866714 RepID=UPI001C7329A1
AALRLPFYLGQFLPALWRRDGKRHPVIWDELGVLPLPSAQTFLLRQLHQDESQGLVLVSEAVRNPFQRWAVQSALQHYLHANPQPIPLLYRLLSAPPLAEYIIAPVEEGDWKRTLPVHRLLLAELDQRWIKSSPDADHFVYRLTRRLRDRRATPLTRFAGMLEELLAQQDALDDDERPFDLSQFQAIYEGVREQPGGAEIARSYATMASYLACKSLTELAAAGTADIAWAQQADAVRPLVLAAIVRLDAVSDDIRAYRDSSSRANRQAALLRATDALKELEQDVQEQVVAPEQHLLRRIIRQWQAIIIAEGGVVGRATKAGPVANPYILNNPAEGERFVGRDDTMRRLEELWSGAGQVPSVVIYGHRRMGKTSILHNLGRRFGAQTVIVDFNMQRVGRVNSDADLLYQLALHIYDECAARGIAGLDEPAEQDFPAERPYLGFTRFLKRLDSLRDGRRLIVTVDEFEKIESQIEAGQLTPALLDFWRGSFMTYPWFVLALAGLYSLEERRHDYWSPLFGSVTGIKVSFLTPGAARRLISEPTPDFDIDYDDDAIAQIIALTGGQPFLIQLIGHTLVSRFNQQSYEEGREQERRFHLADVAQVINAPEFDRDGHAYFSGVWSQAEHSDHGGQLDVLRALAPHSVGLPPDALAAASGRGLAQAGEAITTLCDHDVLIERDGRYVYTVELMRRWVLRRQN